VDLVGGANAILGTGHLPIRETVALVRLARERGLRKILVTHPEASFIRMPLHVQRELSGEGVFYERCYNDVAPVSGQGVPLEEVAQNIRALGIDSTVLSSDFGQAGHPPPTVGFAEYLDRLSELGFAPTDIQTMAGVNPRYLIGL